MLKTTRALMIWGATGLLFACGGGDSAAPTPDADAASVDVMDFADRDARIEEEDWEWEDEAPEGAPRIRRVTLRPAIPESGRMLRALVEYADAQTRGRTMHFEWTIKGEKLGKNSASVRLPELQRGDEIQLSVVASNEAGSSQTARVRAEIPNLRPRVRGLELRQQIDAQSGEVWSVEVHGDDPDGDELEFRYVWLINGSPSEHQGPSFPTSSLKRGDSVRVRVTAHDGSAESRPVESGSIGVANSAPEIQSSPPRLGANGQFEYPVIANDADGDQDLHFELVSGPEGMHMDPSSGLITWTPTLDQAGMNEVEIRVSDAGGAYATQVFSIPLIASDDGEPAPASIR